MRDIDSDWTLYGRSLCSRRYLHVRIGDHSVHAIVDVVPPDLIYGFALLLEV